MALPIVKEFERPSALAAAVNGKLPSSMLTQVGPSGWLERTAARSWVALVAAAGKIGLPLTYTYGGTYRSYAEQLDLFLSRYRPVSWSQYLAAPKEHRKVWPEGKASGYPSNYWVKKDYDLATASTPGESNHGWAIAVDAAFDREPGDGLGPDDAAAITGHPKWAEFQRLVPMYGFSWELTSEPWHIRYVAGANIPAATLEYERGTIPPPPDLPEDDMLAAYRLKGDTTGAVFATNYVTCWWVPSADALNQLIWSRLAGRQPLLDAVTGQNARDWMSLSQIDHALACAFGPCIGPVPPSPAGMKRDPYGRLVPA